MKAVRRLFRRLTSWVMSARNEERLRVEFEEHIAMQTAENLRAGLPPVDARREALLKFGSVEAIKEAYRDQRGLPLTETLVRDTRHALRRLRKAPAFTAAALLTLALGIGANTAMFAVIDSILIRPLSYPHAEDLVSIRHTARGLPGLPDTLSCSPSMYFTYREENRVFQQFGEWSAAGASVTGIAEPEQPRALFVTHGVLDAIGVTPLLGRWFSEADDMPGSPGTVMLTYGYWQRRFGGDPSVIGRTITVDGRPREVIGVMPTRFNLRGLPMDLILPERFNLAQPPASFCCVGLARLKPGATVADANTDVDRMLPVYVDTYMRPNFAGADALQLRAAVRPLKQDVVGNMGQRLWVLLGSISILLLIACANVANLLLVRAETRANELALRASLGAGPGRLARGLMVESITLSMIGGLLGVGFAYGGLKALLAFPPANLPRSRASPVSRSTMEAITSASVSGDTCGTSVWTI